MFTLLAAAGDGNRTDQDVKALGERVKTYSEMMRAKVNGTAHGLQTRVKMTAVGMLRILVCGWPFARAKITLKEDEPWLNTVEFTGAVSPFTAVMVSDLLFTAIRYAVFLALRSIHH